MIKRDARELALKFLFCQEFPAESQEGLNYSQRIVVFQSSFKSSSETWSLARPILLSIEKHQEEIDALIQSHLHNWKLSRLSLTDKNILRIALSEVLHLDLAYKVALNEAIELSKKYSNQESASFINGILDRIFKEKQLKDD